MVPRLKEKVLDFKQVMPGIISLRNPSLKPRHWDQIENIIGKSINKNKDFTLGDLLEMNVSIVDQQLYGIFISERTFVRCHFMPNSH